MKGGIKIERQRKIDGRTGRWSQVLSVVNQVKNEKRSKDTNFPFYAIEKKNIWVPHWEKMSTYGLSLKTEKRTKWLQDENLKYTSL